MTPITAFPPFVMTSPTKVVCGTDHEVTDLTEVAHNDLDYYIYEMARQRDLTRTINETFDHPAEIVDALATFDQAVPHLRSIRNPLTHPSDDNRLATLSGSTR